MRLLWSRNKARQPREKLVIHWSSNELGEIRRLSRSNLIRVSLCTGYYEQGLVRCNKPPILRGLSRPVAWRFEALGQPPPPKARLVSASQPCRFTERACVAMGVLCEASHLAKERQQDAGAPLLHTQACTSEIVSPNADPPLVQPPMQPSLAYQSAVSMRMRRGSDPAASMLGG
ncbi:hypothetical protein B0I35DRAFT_422124 [Stachybotrys elegans]|uniref:Uncharacterized protein n=1 Tax=Stachybotrys elegans TaxID=80388 RepID=A0A8K0WWT8_9HYPO|nr:hypothetical protein B0I35DRAFT_422124 [Stachybotrys elegans]